MKPKQTTSANNLFDASLNEVLPLYTKSSGKPTKRIKWLKAYCEAAKAELILPELMNNLKPLREISINGPSMVIERTVILIATQAVRSGHPGQYQKFCQLGLQLNQKEKTTNEKVSGFLDQVEEELISKISASRILFLRRMSFCQSWYTRGFSTQLWWEQIRDKIMELDKEVSQCLAEWKKEGRAVGLDIPD